MRGRRGDEPETYHLTCPVCGALPGTSCIEEFQELQRVHPSRRMSVAERNRRHAATGWEPPELAERRPGKPDAGNASAPSPDADLGFAGRRRQCPRRAGNPRALWVRPGRATASPVARARRRLGWTSPTGSRERFTHLVGGVPRRFPPGRGRPAPSAAGHREREMAGRGRPSTQAEPGQAGGAPHGRPQRLEQGPSILAEARRTPQELRGPRPHPAEHYAGRGHRR